MEKNNNAFWQGGVGCLGIFFILVLSVIIFGGDIEVSSEKFFIFFLFILFIIGGIIASILNCFYLKGKKDALLSKAGLKSGLIADKKKHCKNNYKSNTKKDNFISIILAIIFVLFLFLMLIFFSNN